VKIIPTSRGSTTAAALERHASATRAAPVQFVNVIAEIERTPDEPLH
jgi:hypothetical protein